MDVLQVWDMFKAAATDSRHINVDEYAKFVSAYIQKCMEDHMCQREPVDDQRVQRSKHQLALLMLATWRKSEQQVPTSTMP